MGQNPNAKLGRKRRVGVLVESSMSAGREILRGIARYAREHGHWSIFYEPGHFIEAAPRWLSRWQGDGLIARVGDARLAARLCKLGLPVVDVWGNVADSGLPLVQVDDGAVAALALTHFIEHGFRQLAFCGIANLLWSERRERAFLAAARQRGCACDVYHFPRRPDKVGTIESQRRRLSAWLAKLPRPVAIFAANDLAAHEVLEVCRRDGHLVPEQVAVLGVDNDTTFCELCEPMLSSVIPIHDAVGYRAAELLDALLDGKPAPKTAIFLRPLRIAVRQSTDALAIDDADVAAAVRFIRQNADRAIGVGEVAAHVAISYTTLKRRFQRTLARSIHEEITRVRIHRVQELLAETSLPMHRIAKAAGFEHQEYLSAIFKAQTGMTPKEYRQQALLASARIETDGRGAG